MSKEKAAILTWCYNNGKTNYGQILQCYAMQEMVRKLGLDPVVIRYRKPDNNEDVLALSDNKRDEYELEYRIKVVEGTQNARIDRFIEFIRDNITISNQCYTVSEIEEETKDCTYLFCGSDQIWNPLWFEEVYALNFGRDDQKRIAYAPSGILDETRQESLNTYKRIGELTERFTYVSVREEKSVGILKKYSSREIHEAIDPTMLHTSDEWDRVSTQRVCDERYIFCYSLGRMRSHKVILRYLMKKYKADRVLFITSGHYDDEDELETDGIFKAVTDAGPSEFISLIKHAEAVCTDSFHGIALSSIYEKQFYIIRRNDPDIELWGSMERQYNLMRTIGITENRMLKCVRDLDCIIDIDYGKVVLNRKLPPIYE